MNEKLIYALSSQILGLLPDENFLGFAILSFCLEEYGNKHGLKSSETWEMINQVAKEVHEIYGEYDGGLNNE